MSNYRPWHRRFRVFCQCPPQGEVGAHVCNSWKRLRQCYSTTPKNRNPNRYLVFLKYVCYKKAAFFLITTRLALPLTDFFQIPRKMPALPSGIVPVWKFWVLWQRYCHVIVIVLSHIHYTCTYICNIVVNVVHSYVRIGLHFKEVPSV